MDRVTLAQKAAPGLIYAGASTSVAGGIGVKIMENQHIIWAAGVFFGIIIGIIGLILTTIYKVKEDRRAEALHRLEVEEILRAREQIEKAP